ncbi:DUF4870 domain-containing protein [Streptomyces platensis]|uniref:DUF4870 domain-containing protein n=1 Tax=Streptomyces platensis TaxID=58346 RepID=A0AAE6NIG1_STRPT|nr:DUF4870 domain-containing protein [Streptomyces platensis]OSY46004.1 hypothetical protein BG653_02502 [Streptomyces platensis]QEV53302.1 DUF4870 domain-containing protein [Streptomyces platensis]
MSDYHQPGYGPPAGGPQQPYGTPPQGWPGAPQPGAPQPGAPQPGGYGYPGTPQPGYGPRPPAPSSGPAMWSHLGALLTITAGTMMCCGLGAFLGWIYPLSLRGNDRHQHDPYIRHHATQAVNYGITQAIMAAFGLVLYVASALTFAAVATEEQRNSSGLAVPLITVIAIFAAYALSGVICAVMATVKATRGELWTYPRLIAWPLSKG